MSAHIGVHTSCAICMLYVTCTQLKVNADARACAVPVAITAPCCARLGLGPPLAAADPHSVFSSSISMAAKQFADTARPPEASDWRE